MFIIGFYDETNIEEVQKPKIESEDLDELANYYITDKGSMHGSAHNYVIKYTEFFKQYIHEKITMLEIGIARGSSLKTWASYFKHAQIDGIDINPKCSELCKDYDNINIIIGDAKTYNTDKEYNIIIDDGSHLAGDMVDTFHHLESKLKINGLYVIEDMHCCRDIEYIKMFKNRYTENEEESFINNNNGIVLRTFLDKIRENEKYSIEHIDEKLCFIRKMA